MEPAVTTTVDGAGRVVIPKPIRARLGLGPGAAVAVSERDGVIEIRPAPVAARIVQRGRVAVIRAESPLDPIDDDDVRAALEATRRP
jgi:AbrB family looped-hinge helix DNA binding protein